MHVLTTAPRRADPACTCSPRRPDVPIRRGMHVLTTAPDIPHRYRVEPAKKIGATVQVAEGPLATALVAEADALAFLARVDPALLIWELTKPPKPTGAVPGASEVLTRTRLRRRLASLGKAWPYVPESAAEAAAAAAAAGAAPDGAARGSGAVNDDDDGNSVRLVVNDQLQALLPLADLVDADKERQRLGKQKSTLEASIATVSKRLNSPGFKDKAKPEILKKAQVRSPLISFDLP
jgi:valyl-tRNA synthetase